MKDMGPLRRWIILGVAFFVLLFGVGGNMVSVVFAEKKLDEEVMLTFGQSGVFYYDPDTCSNNQKCVAPTGNQVTWIGDSYSVGAKAEIEGKLSGITFGESVGSASSTIQGSKFVNKEDNANPGGLQILQKMKEAGELKPYLVFALGTNGGIKESDIDKVVEIAGNDTQIVFTTLYLTTSDDVIQNYVTSSNDVLRSAGNKYQNVSIADWASVAKSEYYTDGVHPQKGYDKWVETIVEALPDDCTNNGASLPGSTVTEKIWNWLVNYFNDQNMSNVDMSALVSGIMGNFYWETGMNPLMYSNGYYGIFMYYGKYGGDGYAKKVNETLGGNYFKYYKGSNDETVDGILKDAGLSEQQINTAINLNMQAMIEYAYWSEFMEGVRGWGVSNTPQGYADLFVTTIERAVGGSATIEDSGVRNHYSGNYQLADKRRDRAKYYYDKYASSTSVNPRITKVSSASALQGTAIGTNKNYAGDTVWSDAQMKLVEKYESVYKSASQQYGVPWQAIATVHRLETGLALANPSNGQGLYQLYSFTGGGKNSNAFPTGEIDMREFERQTDIATGEMKRIIESGGYAVDSDEGIKYLLFNYNGTASQYKNKALAMGFTQEEANVGEGSPYVMNRYDARRDPKSSEMDPNWPGRFTADHVYTEGSTQSDFGGFVLYVSLGGGDGSVDICEERSSGSGKLADYVLKFAWPDYHPATFLEVKTGYKDVYDRRVREGKYVGSLQTYGDCGGFVTTLLQESGFDPDYGGGGNTYVQERYIINSSDWELVNPSYNVAIKDESDLSPGDVAFNTCGSTPGNCKHTYVYVGEIAGFNSHIASASWDKRTPMAGKEAIVANGVNWYHRVK